MMFNLREIIFITLSITIPTSAFINQVPTGSVGVYYKFKELQTEIYRPGMWWNFHPFGYYEPVDIRPQVDYIENVECGTKDGLRVVFPEIAVFNQLQEPYVLETLRKYTALYDNFLIKEPIRQKVVELCTTMDLQDLYIDRFPEINDILHDFLKSYQESFGQISSLIRFQFQSQKFHQTFRIITIELLKNEQSFELKMKHRKPV